MRLIFIIFFIVFTFFLEDGFAQRNGNIPLSEERFQPSRIIFGPLANKQAILSDPLLPEIIQHVREKYGVSAVILYGSRARGEASEKSDYDIIGILQSGESQEYLESFKGVYLDISLYPQKIDDADVEHFPIPFFWEEAAILHQRHHEGEQFIKDIKKAFDNNKDNYSQETKNRILMLEINLDRAQENEIREHFYRHKFLTRCLLEYFPIRDLPYKGPRKSLAWLKKNDSLTYSAFSKAMAPQARFQDLQVLLKQVADSKLNTKAQVGNNTRQKFKEKEKYVVSKDPLLPDIVRYIQATYGAHTIILHGSRAQETASHKSDYDIMAFGELGHAGEIKRDLFKEVYLEMMLCSDEAIDDLKLIDSLGLVKGYIILCQKDNFGNRIIQHMKKIYDEGFYVPDELKQKVVDEIKTRLLKIDNSVAGKYYQHTLLSSLLEHYFTLRDLYYVGSRESFAWIKENDLPTYYAFEKALKPEADLESIQGVVHRVISPFEQKMQKSLKGD